MKTTQLFDHHMHSEFSGDSSQSMEELVQNAIKDEKVHDVKGMVDKNVLEYINEYNLYRN